MDMMSMEEDYKKEKEAVSKALKAAAKKTDSKILADIVKDEDCEADPEKQKKCKMAYMLFDEMIDQFKEGEMTFKEAVDDLYKALKQV